MMQTNELDWQAILDDVMCDIQAAKRDPQQAVLNVQRIQALRSAIADAQKVLEYFSPEGARQ
jgi:hypothetical protein